MRFTSKLLKSLLALVLVLSFSATFSFAADSSNENSNYLTTQGYIEYLELQIEEGDSNASEVLEQFMNLDSTKQEAFVKFLASSEYVESFQTAATTNNGEIEENYVVDGVTVPVTVSKEIEGDTVNIRAVATSASHSTKLSIFGVTTSTLTLTVSWEHDGSVATKALQVRHAHQNSNPAWIISEVSNNNPGYITGGYYHGSGQWKMSPTGSLGAISDSLGIQIKGSNPNHRYYAFTSSHSNMTNIPWTKF